MLTQQELGNIEGKVKTMKVREQKYLRFQQELLKKMEGVWTNYEKYADAFVQLQE